MWETMFKPLLASDLEAFDERPEFAAPTRGSAGHSNEETVTRAPGVVSAIKSRDMMHFLRDRWHVEHLVIGGISTSGCVLSTVQEAADLNFLVTVVEDACFDPDPGVHQFVLDHVIPMTAHVVDQQRDWSCCVKGSFPGFLCDVLGEYDGHSQG